MKQLHKTTIFTIISIIFAIYLAQAAAAETKAFSSSEELSAYILQLVAAREEKISVSIPKTLPEAGMRGSELLRYVLGRDSGQARWGYSGGSATKITRSDHVVFEYRLIYHTTKAQDEQARKLAAGIVAGWDTEGLDERGKMGLLKAYISANWRYDETLSLMDAHSTLTRGRGTCLGMTMAAQLILDELGIASQTVHGTIAKTGELHIRLLVKLGELWHTFDPTLLARPTPDLSDYLKQGHGTQFVPDAEYQTDAFKKSHPNT